MSLQDEGAWVQKGIGGLLACPGRQERYQTREVIFLATTAPGGQGEYRRVMQGHQGAGGNEDGDGSR
jgi:hypothetical protein